MRVLEFFALPLLLWGYMILVLGMALFYFWDYLKDEQRSKNRA